MTDPMQTEAMSDERILHLWDEYVGYESDRYSSKAMPLSREDKLHFARAVLAASELRSLRDALALAKSRIAELERIEAPAREVAVSYEAGFVEDGLWEPVEKLCAALKEASE